MTGHLPSRPHQTHPVRMEAVFSPSHPHLCLHLRTGTLSAADNDEVDVVGTQGSSANVESAWALCEGCNRPDIVGKWCEFILLERILFRVFYDDCESGLFPEAVGIEMSFHVIQNIVNSPLSAGRRRGLRCYCFEITLIVHDHFFHGLSLNNYHNCYDNSFLLCIFAERKRI